MRCAGIKINLYKLYLLVNKLYVSLQLFNLIYLFSYKNILTIDKINRQVCFDTVVSI